MPEGYRESRAYTVGDAGEGSCPAISIRTSGAELDPTQGFILIIVISALCQKLGLLCVQHLVKFTIFYVTRIRFLNEKK